MKLRISGNRVLSRTFGRKRKVAKEVYSVTGQLLIFQEGFYSI
jgi:hypothetical protein